ncbi:zinc ribbon domain-containing protein [Xanthobacter sp.]|uniref:zinc ribbon domain-containing protein n=1 Tax=Xanthobacter sp. TaxID=35809 RepID=UPI0025E59655|nr:zinc ribbon domain-containing protein [Xanthobacter sp.]
MAAPRSGFELEFYVRKLAKNGVKLVSTTQEMGDDRIRTGKGGRYHYYACSMKARQGPTACEGMAVPMEKLDDLVASHLEVSFSSPSGLKPSSPAFSTGDRSNPSAGASTSPN